MKTLVKTSDETSALQKEIQALKEELAQKDALIEHYLSQMRLLQQKRFGRSTEQALMGGDYEQLSLFNEAEALADASHPEESIEEITYERRKRKNKSKVEALAYAVTQTVDHPLPPEQLGCTVCGETLRDFSQASRYEIKIIPAQVEVIEHIEHSYVCDHCEKTGTESQLVKGPRHVSFLPKSSASAESLAWLIEQKYRMHLPLYRQEEQLKEQLGLNLSRQTLSNWLLKTNERYVAPLMTHLKTRLQGYRHLHADETTLTVLNEPDRAAEQKSYMWLYQSGRDEIPLVLYDYRTTRANKHPLSMLSGFTGYLQVDGYSGYKPLQSQGVTLCGCWAHARRKYAEIVKSLPKGLEKDSLAAEALKRIAALYAIEDRVKKQFPIWNEEAKEAIRQLRQEQSAPLVEAYFSWIKEQRALARGLLKNAFDYSLGEEQKLRQYLSNPCLEIDNNRAERSIKPFVIGRKNWLFSNTPRGAEASANFFSLVETTRANGLKVYDYLCYLFNQQACGNTDFEQLMPWSSALPDHLRIKPR